MKKVVKRALRRVYQGVKNWASEPPPARKRLEEIPFDNRYDWLGAALEEFIIDPICARRPHYAWGAAQGVALGKVLGLKSVSLVEFCVASGAGLLALERTALRLEQLLSIGIEVYGFDTGAGLPKVVDHRDCPNVWLGQGQFPMPVAELKQRLQKASLRLGPISETVPEFLKGKAAPVAFASVDVDLYTSSVDALRLFDASYDQLLPRVVCYFDDIMGLTYSDFNGERLAITEFNAAHPTRKLSPLYGLRYYLPSQFVNTMWPYQIYFLHLHDHPLYNEPDELRKPMQISMDSQITGWQQSKKTNTKPH